MLEESEGYSGMGALASAVRSPFCAPPFFMWGLGWGIASLIAVGGAGVGLTLSVRRDEKGPRHVGRGAGVGPGALGNFRHRGALLRNRIQPSS